MIAFISGKIKDKNNNSLCLITQHGIGYEIEMTSSSLCQLNNDDEVELWTVQIIREDAQILCGFLHKDEKEAFKVLIKVSGVGLKMALAILSTLSLDELAWTIERGDDSKLTKISGIGKKTAQRLIIELKDKLPITPEISLLPIDTSYSRNFDTKNKMKTLMDAEQALISLGYKEKEAQYAIKIATSDNLNENDTGELIRQALKILDKS